MGEAGRSCLFSQREKIEMRGRLATATGHRSPPPSRSVTPATQTPSAGDICVPQPKGRTPASRPLGAGRGEGSYLFSQREKIEMRGRLATATGHRSPPPSRSVTRLRKGLHRERVGVRAGGGGGRATFLKPAPSRSVTPSYAKVSVGAIRESPTPARRGRPLTPAIRPFPIPTPTAYHVPMRNQPVRRRPRRIPPLPRGACKRPRARARAPSGDSGA